MKLLFVTLAALSLLGCGGGGGGDTPAATSPTTTIASTTSPEGVYGGTLTGSTSSNFQLLMLENGEFWTVYGTSTASAFLVNGFVQGSGTTNTSNSTFTSANAKDFGFIPGIAGTISATYDATAKTIAGTFTAAGGTVTLNGGPIAGSLYSYNTPAALSNIIGTWSTTSTTGENVAINVTAGGTFSAVGGSGCTFSGTVVPRASGKNVFDTTMTFGPAPCSLAGQTATGIALTYPLADGRTQAIFASVDATRTYGSAAFGAR